MLTAAQTISDRVASSTRECQNDGIFGERLKACRCGAAGTGKGTGPAVEVEKGKKSHVWASTGGQARQVGCRNDCLRWPLSPLIVIPKVPQLLANAVLLLLCLVHWWLRQTTSPHLATTFLLVPLPIFRYRCSCRCPFKKPDTDSKFLLILESHTLLPPLDILSLEY